MLLFRVLLRSFPPSCCIPSNLSHSTVDTPHGARSHARRVARTARGALPSAGLSPRSRCHPVFPLCRDTNVTVRTDTSGARASGVLCALPEKGFLAIMSAGLERSCDRFEAILCSATSTIAGVIVVLVEGAGEGVQLVDGVHSVGVGVRGLGGSGPGGHGGGGVVRGGSVRQRKRCMRMLRVSAEGGAGGVSARDVSGARVL